MMKLQRKDLKRYLICFFVVACLYCSRGVKANCVPLRPPHRLTAERRLGDGVGIVVDTAFPRLSWMLDADSDLIRQSSYQIRASLDAKNATSGMSDGVLWDSGKIESNRTLDVLFRDGEGEPLASDALVFWIVRIWNEADCPSNWSSYSSFQIGRSNEDDWSHSTWISSDFNATGHGQSSNCSNSPFGPHQPNTLLRRTFVLERDVTILKRATIYVSGLGYVRLFLDGRNVPGNTFLDPGLTTVSERVLYATYDASTILQEESNGDEEAPIHTIGISLGNGWYVLLHMQHARSFTRTRPLFSPRRRFSPTNVSSSHHNAPSLRWNPRPLLFWGHLNIRDALPVGTRTVARLELVVEYSDGHRQVVGTQSDGLWRAGEGPWMFNCIYLGTRFDQRRANELEGWSGKPGTDFDDSNWTKAVKMSPDDRANIGTRLIPQMVPPIRAVETLEGSKSGHATDDHALTSDDQETVWDFGRNFAGTIQVTLKGPMKSGTRVLFRFGEILWPNGTLNPFTSVAGQIKSPNPASPCAPAVAEQQDVFISDDLSSEADEATFTPRFTWHGFRYVAISASSSYEISSIHGLVLRSDVDVVGSFEAPLPSSSLRDQDEDEDNDRVVADRMNKIFRMVQNTHASNMMSIQSDCPHRERFGYGGDALATAETSLYLFDMSQFYRKRVLDYVDAQRRDGGFTETAPFVGIADSGLGNASGPIGWASMPAVLQLWMYDYYGDVRTLQESLNATQRWIRFLEDASSLNVESGLSDWMSLEPSPAPLTGRMFAWMNFRSFSKINELLRNSKVAAAYAEKAQAAIDSLNEEFLDLTSGTYGTEYPFHGSQCAQSMPLYFDIVPDDARNAATERLLESLKESTPLHYEIPSRDSRDGVAYDTVGTGSGRTTSDGTAAMRAGMFAIKYLLMYLTDIGRADLALDMVAGTASFPSYGYMLQHGATTLWER